MWKMKGEKRERSWKWRKKKPRSRTPVHVRDVFHCCCLLQRKKSPRFLSTSIKDRMSNSVGTSLRRPEFLRSWRPLYITFHCLSLKLKKKKKTDNKNNYNKVSCSAFYKPQKHPLQYIAANCEKNKDLRRSRSAPHRLVLQDPHAKLNRKEKDNQTEKHALKKKKM